MLPPITSRQNARVRELRAALAGRAADGFAAVEGDTLVGETLASGLEVVTVYLREDRQALAGELPAGLEAICLGADAFRSAAATEQSQGVAVLLKRPEQRYQPATGDLVVVAAGLQDPGNLGTLIRSAEAFGAAAVALAENTVDPWNGKALRASAGSVFRMPLPPWTGALHTALRTAGLRLFAAVPDRNATPAHAADLRGGCALLIGNEGKGLSTAMLALADEQVTLHMPGATESLNAAVAAAVLLYEAQRQRAGR